MVSKLYKINVRQDYLIDVTFFNGSVKRYDAKGLEAVEESYRELREDEDLFKDAAIDGSKSEIVWKNGAHLSNEAIWYDSILIEVIDIEDAAVAFAERLRTIREGLKVTQKELEARTGITQADISRIERAESNPSIRTMEKLVSGLGYSLFFDARKRHPFARPEIPIADSLIGVVDSNKCQGEFTVDDILAIDNDWYYELIDGVIYEMATPTFSHQDIISEVHYALMEYIKGNGGSCKVVESPTSVEFEEDNRNYLIPDLIVICDRDKIKKRGVVGAPDFVLEVVSPSSRDRDYTIKMNLYMKNGVREYWVIEPEKRCIIVYNLDEDVMPVVYGFDKKVPVNIYNGEVEIDLSNIEKFE